MREQALARTAARGHPRALVRLENGRPCLVFLGPEHVEPEGFRFTIEQHSLPVAIGAKVHHAAGGDPHFDERVHLRQRTVDVDPAEAVLVVEALGPEIIPLQWRLDRSSFERRAVRELE